MSTKLPKPEAIPIEANHTLNPTHAFYILHTKPTTTIHDLSSSITALFPLQPTPSPDVPSTSASPPPQPTISLALGATLLKGTPAPKVVYTLKKENLFGTHLSVKNEDGKEVAEWKSPVLSLHLGRTSITFLKEEGKEGEKVEVKPTGFARRAESFIKDGMTYIWEIEAHKHEHKNLYKVIHTDSDSPTKIEIARFSQPTSYNKDGVLVLDSREIDDLVCILTLCAMLETTGTGERTDEFTDSGFASGLYGM